MESVGPTESVGGDIKFLRLKQLQVGGLVTNGSVRDTDEIINYGFPCFSYSTTARQGPAAMVRQLLKIRQLFLFLIDFQRILDFLLFISDISFRSM